MTPILYSSDEIDFLNNGLGQLVDLYDVDIHEQRNGLLNLTAYYPVNGQHYADISEGNIILAKPSPLDDNHAFRIVSVALDITGYAVMIEADSITYDLTNNLSKTIHMLGDGQSAMTAIQNSTLHPHIFTFYSDITHTSESRLRYVNPMEAIAGTQGSFLQIWGGELKRENRRVAMFNRRGRDNVATFRLGKNVAGLKYTVDVSNLTTEIVPTVTVNSTDASRTIEGATVQSSRMGTYPLVYSKMVDVSQDVKVDEGDTDDQIKAKINAFAADWFVKSANTGKDLPEVTAEVEVESLQDSADYADKFAKLETIGLTDTVTVYVPEFGVNITAIVNELHYDPVAERVTKLSIGTAKVSWADSNKNALNDLQDKVTEVKEQATQAVVSANGKNSNYSGRNEPAHPQEGDTWFWDDGADSGIRVFTNGKWVDSADTKTLERIDNAVDSAIDTSKKYADDLNAKQAKLTSDLNDKVDKTAKELTESQAVITSKANAYTDSAVSQANTNAQQIGATTAQNAQKALENAIADVTNDLQKETTERNKAVADVNNKAQSYATQAKNDAIEASKIADGITNKRIDETEKSLSLTISQNKADADEKISTAQTTATQALDGLATKVSQTEYNTKTGQLQTDLTATAQTANQAKTDIVSIKQKNGEQDERMNSIVSDANGTKQTISNLQTVQGKQSGDIATLQSRADGFEATVTKVNNLAVGGRNYLLNSSGDTLSGWDMGTPNWSVTSDDTRGNVFTSKPSTAWTGGGANSIVQSLSKDTIGKEVTVSFWAKASVDGANFHSEPQGGANAFNPKLTTTWARYSYAISSFSGRVYFMSVDAGTTYYIDDIKLELGNVATDWSPAPEDVSSATAKAQLTADQATLAINNYKTDADGRISKAQADIKVNANAIGTKVAKTDYDKKTNDLTTSVNKAQQTADSATQTIGTYKESNDKRVSAAETNIKANSDAILQTVSKTDFDKATGKFSGDISTLKQRADGFDATITKVNNLAVGGRNYLLNSSGTTLNGWRNSTSPWSIANDTTRGSVFSNTPSATWTGGPANSISQTPTNSVVNKQVTVSFWAKASVNGAKFHSEPSGGANALNNTLTTSWSRYSYVIQSFSGTIYFMAVDAGTTYYLDDVKLELGNVATDWTPAPEDIDSNIAQVKLTADGLYETVNNPKTGIATRLLTAEGTITTVQNTTNELTSKQTVTAGGLTQEISDRKNGDQAVRTDMATLINQQVTSVTTGYQSSLLETSNALVAQISSLNLLNNSQFEVVNGTLPGWHVDTPWGDTVKVGAGKSNNVSVNGPNPDGTMSLIHDYGGNSSSWLYSDPIPTMPNSTYSGSFELAEGDGWATSSQVSFARYIRYYTSDHVLISSDATNYFGGSIGGAWPQYSFTVKTPANAAYVSFGMGWNGGKVSFRHLSMYSGSKNYGYMPSSKSGNQTVLQLFKDNWAIGIKDNAGNLINGINGDSSGMTIAAKKLTVSADTTFLGTNWLNGAVIKDASISNAQIGDAAITSAKIVNLDVNKITGEVANFIRAYWDGQYGSTSITSEGMTVTAGVTTTVFDENGMQLNKSNRSVGRIGVNDLYQDNSKKGLYFGLESTGDFMAWGAQNYAGNPYDTKLSWYRVGSVPSNLIGTIEGFNFQDNVLFNRPVEMRAGIKVQGTDDRLVTRATSLNGRNSPSFGTSSAGFAYVSDEVYLISNGTAYNLSKVIKALSGISSAAIPTGFASDGKATGWYNVNFR